MENIEYEKIKRIKDIYGLSNVNIRYIKDKTIIDSFGDKVSFLLDNNYNIIDISDTNKLNEKYINNLDYSKLAYPLDNYTISDIINISNDIDVSDNIFSNSLKVNDMIIVYVKFLNLLIERYYDMSFHFQKIGYKMPSVKDYISTIIDKISETVISDLRLHKRTSAIELMSSIGLKDDYIIYYNYIKNIINLYMENMGLKNVLGSVYKLEYNDNRDSVNVKDVADMMLNSYKEMKEEKSKVLK